MNMIQIVGLQWDVPVIDGTHSAREPSPNVRKKAFRMVPNDRILFLADWLLNADKRAQGQS